MIGRSNSITLCSDIYFSNVIPANTGTQSSTEAMRSQPHLYGVKLGPGVRRDNDVKIRGRLQR